MTAAMRPLSLLAALATVPLGLPHEHSKTSLRDGRTPVLLELFTSEGCSSCPPADKLLQELDRSQPIIGADLIVLSEHVDYWDHLGWRDPASSPVFTERQRDYASKFGSDVYTPQLVVDGSTSIVGSDRSKAENAVNQLLRRAKLPLDVTAERNEGVALIHISISQNSAKRSGTVYLVVARDHTQSDVARGENAGRALSHVAVAYSMQQIAGIKPNVPFKKDLRAPLPRGSSSGDIRLIVFVQQSGKLQIIGVAQTRL